MIVSKDQFRILKERWQAIEDDNYKDIDPRMVSTLCMLNDIPGVATVWCCSGHTYEESIANDEYHSITQKRYVSFVFDSYEAQRRFCEVVDQWRLRQRHSAWVLLRDTLSCYSLVWCFHEYPKDVGRGHRYSIWNMEVNYNSDFLIPIAIMEREWSKLITSLCKQLGQ